MQFRFLFVIVSIVGLLTNSVAATTFFFDDFDSYALDPDVAGVGGWSITNTATTVENEADWHLLETKSTAAFFLFPSTVNVGAATTGGLSTPGYDPTGLAPGGHYMMSLAGGIPGGGLSPTFPSGTTPDDPNLPDKDDFDSRIDNGTYTGASNDMVTPSFSTAGAAGDVWLHASVSANLNDGGQAIFDVDVSTDGGATWVNKFRRIAPGAGRNIASGDFDADLDVDGIDFLSQQRDMNFADAGGSTAHDIDTNRRDTDQRFSDWGKAFNGSYTPLVATIGATLGEGNAGGHHGELDLNLGAIGGNGDVKVRFRHFESRDDEQIALDNVRVDEDAPLGSGPDAIFLEDFNTKTLGSMGVYTYTSLFGAFGSDSGGGSGTISGHSWGTQDRNSVEFPTGRYNAGVIGQKGVNHLGHPTAEGASGEVPFAIIDPKAEEDNVDPADNIQSERLHTPLLDLSGYDSVILEWDSETIFGGNPLLGSVASVVLMEDTDGNGPDNGDLIIAEPNKLADIAEPYAPYDQFGGGFFAGGDDSIFHHHRIDITSLVNHTDVTDKDALYIAFQFFSQDTDYWAVDNVRLTGTLTPESVLAAVAAPEPSSLLLALVGLPVFGAMRRRRRIG